MAAEPATTRRRVRSDGSWEDVGEEHLRSISVEMDADLEAIHRSAAAAATTATASAAAATSPHSAGVAQGHAAGLAQGLAASRRVAQVAVRDVSIDPRLLTKPGMCPTERGTTWRLWRTKLEGWIYGVDVRIGQALELAANHQTVIVLVPGYLKQASSFIYAELLGATSGVQMEVVLEVSDRNGFEAWRRLVLEMERDTVNRKLAVIESLSRPDFGVDLSQWRQRWKRWEREVKHYLPQVGTAMTEAMRIAIVRQRTPGELQRHLKLNAMSYGERYDAFHDLIEAYFGADEGETIDNTYGSLEVGYVNLTQPGGNGDIREKKRFNCGKLGHFAKECRGGFSSSWNTKGDKNYTGKSDGKGSKGNKGDGKQNAKDSKERKCFQCGKTGHIAKECRSREVCFKCGKPGHRQKDCKEVHQLEQVPQPGDDKWCFMIAITKTTAITETIAQNGDTLELAVDSGTEVHVIPFKWVTKLMKWVEGPKLIMRSAGGEQLKHYGRVEVLLQVGTKLFKIYLEVVDARRALLSVSAMLDNGWEVDF